MELIPLLSTAAALVIAWLFAVAGVAKLDAGNRSYYQQALANYGFSYLAQAPWSVAVIGGVEVSIALSVPIPGVGEAGLALGGVVLATYTGLIGLQLARGRAGMACGCSGPAAAAGISPALLIRNLVYLGVLVLAASGGPVTGWASWLLALALATGLILTALSADQLLANRHRLQQFTRLRNFPHTH